MLIEIFSDTEYGYRVELFCPKCGSSDVVIEFMNGFYYFSSCNKCGYRKVSSLEGDIQTK